MEQAIAVSTLVYYVSSTILFFALLIGFVDFWVGRQRKGLERIEELQNKLEEEKARTAEIVSKSEADAKAVVEQVRRDCDREKKETDSRFTKMTREFEDQLRVLSEKKRAVDEQLEKIAEGKGVFVDEEVVNGIERKFDDLKKWNSNLSIILTNSVMPALETCESQLKAEYDKNLNETIEKKNREWGERLDAEAAKVKAAEEAQAKADAALEKVRSDLGAEKDETERLRSENADLAKRLGEEPALREEVGQLKLELQAKVEELSNFDWLRAPLADWAGTINSLGDILGTQTDWYTSDFYYGILQALMSMRYPIGKDQEAATVNGTPDEIMARVDEAFYARLNRDEDLAVLEEVRSLFFGRFNELYKDRYEFRWPKTGESFDESYCRLDRDNGFTEVRVAISAAIFEDGELKRRARVETVARA